MAHPNADLARKATDALSKGDMETFLSFHTDDTILHFPGRGPLAGDHKGKDGLVQLFQKQMEMLDGPPEIMVHGILADDEHFVVLNNARGTRKGQTLEQQPAVGRHPRHRKIAEARLQLAEHQAMAEMPA